MCIFSCSAHKGHFKLTFCLLKCVSYFKTVIFNGFLYEEIIYFFVFLRAQNIRHLLFIHKMINHEIIQMSPICAAFDKNIALRANSGVDRADSRRTSIQGLISIFGHAESESGGNQSESSIWPPYSAIQNGGHQKLDNTFLTEY